MGTPSSPRAVPITTGYSEAVVSVLYTGTSKSPYIVQYSVEPSYSGPVTFYANYNETKFGLKIEGGFWLLTYIQQNAVKTSTQPWGDKRGSAVQICKHSHSK